MCLIRIGNNTTGKSDLKERSAKEWIHMAQQVRQAGTLGLLLTGGEPMLRPDFVDIYSEIASMGFILTVYTNATLITQDIFNAFKKYPPHTIGITVYGASERTYGLVTGSEDAYDRMLMGVDKLRQLPSKLTIRSTIIKDNLEDLDKINSWAKSFGPKVDFNVSRIVTMPVRGGVADVESCRLSPEQNVSMLKKIYIENIINPLITFFKDHPDISSDKEIVDIIAGRKEERCNNNNQESDIKPTIYGCDAGVNSYTITWDGTLIGCQMLNDCCTYPFLDGFLQAWDMFPGKVKLQPVPDKCRGCSTPCTSCYATRLSETGNMEGWPEYICSEAKLKEKMEDVLMSKLNASLVQENVSVV
jgi:MoaA/NifB/PqqE/SkfB family radical SAM enzyme